MLELVLNIPCANRDHPLYNKCMGKEKLLYSLFIAAAFLECHLPVFSRIDYVRLRGKDHFIRFAQQRLVFYY